MPVETLPTTREDVARELAECELRLFELREIRKRFPNVKSFWLFRIRDCPESSVWVYSSDRETADKILAERLTKSYGTFWSAMYSATKEFTAENAALQCAGSNLIRSISPAEIESFLKDYAADKEAGLIAPRGKDMPASTLETDIANYHYMMKTRLQK